MSEDSKQPSDSGSVASHCYRGIDGWCHVCVDGVGEFVKLTRFPIVPLAGQTIRFNVAHWAEVCEVDIIFEQLIHVYCVVDKANDPGIEKTLLGFGFANSRDVDIYEPR